MPCGTSVVTLRGCGMFALCGAQVLPLGRGGSEAQAEIQQDHPAKSFAHYMKIETGFTHALQSVQSACSTMASAKPKLNKEKLGPQNLNGVLAPTKSAAGALTATGTVAGKTGFQSINFVVKSSEVKAQNKWDHHTRLDKPDSAVPKSAPGKDGRTTAPTKQDAPKVDTFSNTTAGAYACALADFNGSSVSFSSDVQGASPSAPPYWGTLKLALNDNGNALVKGVSSSMVFNNIPLPSAAWQPRHSSAANSDKWSATASATVSRAVSPQALVKPFNVPGWLGQWAPSQLSSKNDTLVVAANNKSMRLTASAVRGPLTISHAPPDATTAQQSSARFAKTHANALGGVSFLATAPVPPRGDTSAQPSAATHVLASGKPVLSPKVIATGTVNSKTELSVDTRRRLKRFMTAVGLPPPLDASGKDQSRAKRTIEASLKGTLQLLSLAPQGKSSKARSEQVGALDMSLYCGVLYPLMFAAKGGCSLSLPPPPADAIHRSTLLPGVQAGYSPLQSAAHAWGGASGGKGPSPDIKSSWCIAGALDCGWAGVFACSTDQKLAGPTIGWKFTESLFPLRRGNSASVQPAADAVKPTERSAAETAICGQFRETLRGSATETSAQSAMPRKREHNFAGRVGSVKCGHSGQATSANLAFNIAAALQPWHKLSGRSLQECVRSWTAGLSISAKHAPRHTVRKGGAVLHAE